MSSLNSILPAPSLLKLVLRASCLSSILTPVRPHPGATLSAPVPLRRITSTSSVCASIQPLMGTATRWCKQTRYQCRWTRAQTHTGICTRCGTRLSRARSVLTPLLRQIVYSKSRTWIRRILYPVSQWGIRLLVRLRRRSLQIPPASRPGAVFSPTITSGSPSMRRMSCMQQAISRFPVQKRPVVLPIWLLEKMIYFRMMWLCGVVSD